MSISNIPLASEPLLLDSQAVLAQAKELLSVWMTIGPTRVLNGLTMGELAQRVAEIEHIEDRMSEVAAEISWTQITQQFTDEDQAI